jgi:glycosyltransferase involved in cell wall biosynthesis
VQSLSLIIPAHNEEKRIGKTLKAYSDYFEKLEKNKSLKYEILIVINNTKDKTEEIVKSAKSKNKRISYLNLKPGGKGYAVIEGFKDALSRDFDLIGFVDADLATPPEEYFKLVQNIKNQDGIIADRYLKDSKVFPPNTFRRVVVSRIFNFLARSLFLFPFRDTQCGAKLFTKKSLEKIIPSLSMSQWAFDIELLFHLKRNGFKIAIQDTVWQDMEFSKINFLKAGPMMAFGIIRLRILNSPFKDFMRIYDRFKRK